MIMEMLFLHLAGLDRVDIQQPLDVGSHPLVDQREQPARCRVEAVVEVENPVIDMSEVRVHRTWL